MTVKRIDTIPKLIRVNQEDWIDFKTWLVRNNLSFSEFVRMKISDVLSIIRKQKK